MVPSREIFWNIPLGWLVYVVGVAVIALMVSVMYRRYKMWHIGKPDDRLGDWKQRIWPFIVAALVDGVVHRKFFGVFDNLGHRPAKAWDFKPKELYAGLAHFLIFAGCFILLIGTAMVVISHYVYDFITGGVYFGHLLALNIGGLMAIVGVIMEVVRRYGRKPDRLDNKTEDLMALLAVLIVVVTGFIQQGLRQAAGEILVHPDWSIWAPVGYILARAFVGLGQDNLKVFYGVWWWVHMFIGFGAMTYIALNFNRLWHIIVSPWNVFFKNTGPRGVMPTIDMEKAQSFGISRIEDLSWKHILDLDACTRCGRCTDNCPAHLSGKPLNPKKVIQDLKGLWLERAPVLLKSKSNAVAEKAPEGTAQAEVKPASGEAESKPLIGGAVQTDEIWNCTTCFACQEVCPVCIEPMSKLLEMRRNLVLEQASVPETAEGALRSIEDRGHPWRGTLLTRTNWCEGLGIKPMSENSDVDILYWVGCTEALEDRSLKVAQATARLLKQAGIKFGILGAEECCCGDPARRMGNEYLYQMQAQKNIEVMKAYNVKRIVTGCPHCYNTLKYEYPQFGAGYEVIHHTTLISQLLQEGKLKLSKSIQGTVTYHDACYLGRYNYVFDTPRQILGKLPGIKLVEMARNRERSFCCGAGGGHLWLEEQKVGERINVMRTEQAMAVKAKTIATACPYCLQMFVDGIKTKAVEESLKVMDIAELVEGAM